MKYSTDSEQLIMLLSEHNDRGLDWYEQASLLGWQCRIHPNVILSQYQRDDGPEICHCVRLRIRAARVAARREGHVISWVADAKDGTGRRDIFFLDRVGDDAPGVHRIDHNTKTRITMYANDIRTYRQIARNIMLPEPTRQQFSEIANQLRGIIGSQQMIREFHSLEPIKLPEWLDSP